MDPSPQTDPTSSDPYGAFRVGAAGAPGVTRRQASSSRFAAPSRGVRYARDDPDPRRAERECALLGSRDGAVLVGLSAAEHWGLPLPPAFGLARSATVVVAVDPDSSRPVRRGVRGRRLLLPAEHLTNHLGQPLTTPARTWVDCAADVRAAHLVAMGDAILRRGLADRDTLARLTRWAVGRRGVVTARRVLPWLDPAAESPGESQVRTHLLEHGIPRPVCNLDIHDEWVWIARVDLCWPAARVIVEYDGAVHLQEEQRRRDAARRNRLQQAGWLVITFTADDLRQPDRMAAQVRAALAARTPSATGEM